MKQEPYSKLDLKSKNMVVRLQAPALFLLAILIIVAIACIAIFANNGNIKMLTIFLLFIGFMQVVYLLAAVLGFRIKKED